MKKEQPKIMLRITHIILNFTCKWINQSKGIITKQYNGISQRNQKQTKETKHNITQNMFKVKG